MLKSKSEQLGINIANMLVGITIAVLLMLEFDLTWKAGAAFYLISFNFMRVVGRILNDD